MKRAAIFRSVIFFTLSVVTAVAQDTPASPAPAQTPAQASPVQPAVPAAKGDFSIGATAVLSGTTTGHGITQSPTTSGGGLMSGRIYLKAHTGVEVNYGFTKSSQVYNDVHGNYTELQTHIHEITAAYILRANRGKFRPFAEGGGGVLVFTPLSAALAVNSNNLSFRANQQTRFSLLYAFGVDAGLTKRLSARIQYRGFLYKAPDFGVSYFNDGCLAHINEPSAGLVWRF